MAVKKVGKAWGGVVGILGHINTTDGVGKGGNRLIKESSNGPRGSGNQKATDPVNS